MAYNPKDHITKIKGKDYLQVADRVQWFRDQYPNGIIATELQDVGGMLVVRATIHAEDGAMLASGLATVRSGENQVWSGRDVEKAETAAVGRALAFAGFGTQFAADELSEGEYLADSPRENPLKKTAPLSYWANKDNRQKLYIWASQNKAMSKEDVCAVLGVDKLENYTGTREQAFAILNEIETPKQQAF